MSHGPEYILFRAAEVASPALKSFAETGRSDLIDQGAQVCVCVCVCVGVCVWVRGLRGRGRDKEGD